MDCLTLKKSNCKNCYKCIRHCPVKAIQAETAVTCKSIHHCSTYGVESESVGAQRVVDADNPLVQQVFIVAVGGLQPRRHFVCAIVESVVGFAKSRDDVMRLVFGGDGIACIVDGCPSLVAAP